ncbi:MAG: adenylate kinase [Chlamydiae bacterium RIFCSPHIGHO2_12_FULL_27_8]|nr:MAG: adenylate kinase [Chlamydiae bacterium RIFCSPHIGHO2_12_FULL_27_8]
MKHKPLVIIMMGPPGAGKGTHATELSKDLKLPHISTGDLFRENIKQNTDLGKKAKSLIDKGVLVPDDIVNQMLFDYINKHKYFSGYILDGYPRNVDQAIALEKFLPENTKLLVINLRIDDDLLVERITGRLMCRKCGKPFHKTFSPPPNNQNICDDCGGEIYQRSDDTKEVVVKRLEVYHRETKPVLNYLKNKAKFIEIDASQSKEKVYKDILLEIEKNK